MNDAELMDWIKSVDIRLGQIERDIRRIMLSGSLPVPAQALERGRPEYSQEQRIAVLEKGEAMMAAGASGSDAAAALGISQASFSRWRDAFRRYGAEGLATRKREKRTPPEL